MTQLILQLKDFHRTVRLSSSMKFVAIVIAAFIICTSKVLGKFNYYPRRAEALLYFVAAINIRIYSKIKLAVTQTEIAILCESKSITTFSYGRHSELFIRCWNVSHNIVYIYKKNQSDLIFILFKIVRIRTATIRNACYEKVVLRRPEWFRLRHKTIQCQKYYIPENVSRAMNLISWILLKLVLYYILFLIKQICVASYQLMSI